MDNTINIKGHNFHRHVLLEITKKCNLNCMHCFTDAGLPLSDELNINNWEIVTKDLITNGFNAFTVSGGEPLIDLDKTIKIIKHIKSLNHKVKTYLFTNGLLLDEQTIKKIKPFINGVGLSLDGIEKTHNWLRGKENSYIAVLEALDLLRNEKIPVFIQSMITPQTLPYIEDVVWICINKNVKAIRFSHVDFYGRAIKNKQTLGCSQNHLILLNNKLKKLKQKYNIYITSNLVYRIKLEKNQPVFMIPSLHIFPNGYVLPWYGFPIKLALCKYPIETFSNLKQQILSTRISAFKKIMDKSRTYVSNSDMGNIIDYDNIVACFIDCDTLYI